MGIFPEMGRPWKDLLTFRHGDLVYDKDITVFAMKQVTTIDISSEEMLE